MKSKLFAVAAVLACTMLSGCAVYVPAQPVAAPAVVVGAPVVVGGPYYAPGYYGHHYYR